MTGGGDLMLPSRLRFRKLRRIPVRLDLTPMVGVAFLLLIAAMVIVTFRGPFAIEMTRRPGGHHSPIGISKVLFLRVFPGRDRDPIVYWNRGEGTPRRVAMSGLKDVLNEESGKVDGLVTSVRIARDVPYHQMMRVTDDLVSSGVCELVMDPLTEKDRILCPGWAQEP
jgi:biopolymer transport protein ExbD